MPIRKAVGDTGKFFLDSAGPAMRKVVDSATPQFSTNPTAPTARDYSTSGLAGAVAVILIAVLHHGVKVDLSPEVVAALTTVIGFLLARFFRY